MRRHHHTFLGILTAIFVCSISNTTNAQNLVPNGSFEEEITCPTQIANVTSECANWYASILNNSGSDPTPDWFHTCSENEFLSPPEVAFGTQVPLDGDGYAGLNGYNASVTDNREVIGVGLVQPLTIGETYLVAFYVNNMTPIEIAIASNKLGFNFSTHQYYNLDGFPTNTSHFAVEEIIPVSDDWLLVSHLFTADSAYNYLHIGNYYDDDNTSVDLSAENPLRTYYAIDDVSVSIVLSNGKYDNHRKNNVELYPNPTSSQVNVSLKNGDPIKHISMYAADGTNVLSIEYKAFKLTVVQDISALSAGVYIVNIVTNKTIYNETLIKL